MSKRRLLFSLGLILCVPLLGILTFQLVVQKPRINRASYEKIAFGMTAGEVEAILGVPPGNYLDNRGYGIRYREFESRPTTDLHELWRISNSRTEHWLGEGGGITIGFDNQGLVVRKQFGQCTYLEQEEPVLARLFRWFDW